MRDSRSRLGALWATAALVAVGSSVLARSAAAQVEAMAASPRPASTREFRLAVARRVMIAARFSSLVTNGVDGRAQARIVDPLPPGPAMEVYIATNPKSRKVSEIRRDRRVTLLYFDPATMAYVTVMGEAEEVTGSAREGHYKDEWAGFFPRDQPGTWTLYRIRPKRLEVVSAGDGLSGDGVTWRPDAVEFR